MQQHCMNCAEWQRQSREIDRLRAENTELLMFIEAGLGGMAKSNPLIAMHLKALVAKSKAANETEGK